MTLATGTRRVGASVLIRAAAVLVALFALGAFAASSRASSLNIISSSSTSVAPGTAPVDSLPVTADAPPGTKGGTQYVAPMSTSTSPTAGSDNNFSESYVFDYGGASPDSTDGLPDHTIQTLDLTLPPGLLASLAATKDFCTPSELGAMPVATSPTTTTNGTGWLGGPPNNAGCPADSQIGEIAGSAYALSATLPISGNLYLMKPTASSDVAEIGVEVEAGLNGTNWFRVLTSTGSIRFALDGAGQPELQVALPLPPDAALGGSQSTANTVLYYTLLNLTETINGLSPAGAPFVRMPTSDAVTTGATNVTVQTNGYNTAGNYDPTTGGQTVPGASGSASGSITPTGAGSLPYSPQLSGSVVRDSTDRNVGLTTSIAQPAGQAASQSIVLHLPSILQPNVNTALQALCVNPSADDAGCTPVGTVTATTSLLPVPLQGKLYLAGTPSGLTLDLVFPAPFAIKISGTVDLPDSTVTFPTVPDMSLTDLQVAIAGGANGIYETTCTANDHTGSLSAAFTGQNGATASSTAPFSIGGCPATVPPVTPAPPVTSSPTPAPAPHSHLKVLKPSVRFHASRLSTRRESLSVAVTARKGSAGLRTVQITAPSGVRFVGSAIRHGVKVHGAKVRSVRLVRGRIVIQVRGSASRLTVSVNHTALHLSSGLTRRLHAHHRTTLRLHVTVVTTTNAIQTLTATTRV